MKKYILIIILLTFFTQDTLAQKVALRSDRNASIKIDGQDKGSLTKEQVEVFQITRGKHVIQAISDDSLYKLEEVFTIYDSTQSVFYLNDWKLQLPSLLSSYFDEKYDAYVNSSASKAFIRHENGDIRSEYLFIINNSPVEILSKEYIEIKGKKALWVKCRHTKGWMYFDDLKFVKRN